MTRVLPLPLDALAAQILAATDTPGLAVCAVTASRTVLARGYGHATLDPPLAATESTPFLAASVSKLVVAATILALAERRMIELDRDVCAYLPFIVRHPTHRAVPITVRALLQHTSGIEDDLDRARSCYVQGDAEATLEAWLAAHFGVGSAGEATRGFGSAPPGTSRRYSNTGFAIAALAAERAARLSFDELAKALVLRPLAMSRSSFRLGDLVADEVATPYRGGFGEPLLAVTHYGYPDYPTGTLRTSAADLGRFVRCMLSGGTLDGARVLSATWVGQMLAPDDPSRSLGWQMFERSGRLLFGHEGQDLGAASRVLLDVERDRGIVILANASWASVPERARSVAWLEEALFEIAAQARSGSAGGER